MHHIILAEFFALIPFFRVDICKNNSTNSYSRTKDVYFLKFFSVIIWNGSFGMLGFWMSGIILYQYYETFERK